MRSPSEGLGGDRPRHEYYFLQFDQKISKYLPKQPRFGKVPTVEKSRPTLVLYLRVRIYIDRVDLIQCPVALHHYYMQLRENLLDQWSGSNSVSAERCWALAALALQTDKGETDDMDYFRPEKYFPLWVINSHGLDFVRKSMPGILKSDSSRRLTQREAMFQFCQEASRSPYALNCHLYGLRRQKNDVADNALIGITDAGIDMWDIGEDGDRSPLRSLAWSKMARLSFDRKRLSIGGLDGSKMSLYAQSETKTRSSAGMEQRAACGLAFRPPDSIKCPFGPELDVSISVVARPRTPLSFNGHSHQTSVTASETAASDLNSLNEDVDIEESAASEIERAMNSAPSPPKVSMSDQHEVDELEQQLHAHHEAVREASDPTSNRTGSVISSCTMSSHHSQRSNDEILHTERIAGSAHELTDAELLDVMHSMRTPQISEGPPTPMQNSASRSMHDLRTVPASAHFTNPDVIRQPPRYNDAVAQLHRTRLAHLQEIHQQRSLPEVAAKSQAHPRQPRWTTVAGDGADPDLLDVLERMRIQQQQENMQRLQQHNVQTMHQLSSYPYGPSLAKSEPRLNGESLPSAQIAMIANGVARTNGTAVAPPVNATIAQYIAAQAASASTPPSYADALELRQRNLQQVNGPVVVPVAEQQQQVMARQQQLQTNGLAHAASMEANGPTAQPPPASQKLKNFPMMRMLLEDDGTG
ncbi:CRE-FRM-7 protein [Aphelenchoides avenae]|nr:CRE-FRM-7 protein [Aphelenchus avenae]